MKRVFTIVCLLGFSTWTYAQSILLDPSQNQVINATRNLPELNLYSTGFVPFAGIKFFDDATFKTGIFYNGFYDGIGFTNDANNPGVFWQNTLKRLGVNTFEPRGGIHIKANSLAEEPQLLIHQTNDSYGRINFESNVPANGRWTLSGSINATSSLSRFNIFSSQAGANLMTFTGEGNVGVGVDNPEYPLHIKAGSSTSNSSTGSVSIGSNGSRHMNIGTYQINAFYGSNASYLSLNGISGGDVYVGNNYGNGDLIVENGARLGGVGAPAIKTKRLWGQLLNSSGSAGIVAHGVNAENILSIQAVVKDGSGNYYPASGNGVGSSTYQYRTYCDATNCYIKDAGSALTHDYFTILLVYMD
ncbi:hypothetical protein [Arcticibacterium luteifluviistationis]|uniref:Uncharacterized protein n=1 Tax=Arcticibacterium luteifluviistationis TaxID=1784714 RepID=A0A2Z4GAE3_9BACT|nr:hypothetical protein [Arcticibacterium luteifluviistationis]AWV98229.1 hypothetical protein DJ013_08620 [Arcticibacterium luteifluviistationis]